VKLYAQRKSYRPGRDLGQLVLEGISDQAAQLRIVFGVVAVPESAQSLRSLHFLFSCMQLSARGREAPLCCTYCRHLASKRRETADLKKALLPRQR
jgi:hypothetical protein